MRRSAGRRSCSASALHTCASRRYTSAPKNSGAVPPYLLIGALVAVAWPPLMRPLLDGDSLSYHLPNAASWVQAHSIWTTATRYWWYPPASELFAAALYATSGPFSLPWSGFAALVLLGFRIAAWARTMWAGAPLLADALAAATVTAYPLAIQAGTLQNDVWLAAFFLESLWSLRAAHGAATRTLAVTALIKPQGWIFAAIALATSKSRPALWLSTGGVLVLWLARNAILWSHAIVAPASTEYGGFFASTILAHGWPALAILARVAFITSPFASIALLAALTAPSSCGGSEVLRGLPAPLDCSSSSCLSDTQAPSRSSRPAHRYASRLRQSRRARSFWRRSSDALLRSQPRCSPRRRSWAWATSSRSSGMTRPPALRLRSRSLRLHRSGWLERCARRGRSPPRPSRSPSRQIFLREVIR